MFATILFDPISRFFWSISIFLLFYGSFLFLFQGFSRTENEDRVISFGLFYLLIGLAFSRLFYFISDYFKKGIYDGHNYISVPGENHPFHSLFTSIAMIVFLIGMSGFYIYYEILQKTTKCIPVLINLLIIIGLIFSNNTILTAITYIGVIFNAILMISIFIFNTRNNNYEIRIFSNFFMTGMSFYIIGSILDSKYIISLDLVSPVIPALFILFGTIICIFSLRFKRLNYHRLWFLGFFLTFCLILGLTLMLFISFKAIFIAFDNYLLLISLSITIVMILIIFINALYHFVITIKIIKGDKSPFLSLQSQDLLSLFFVKTSTGKINLIRDEEMFSFNDFENYKWDANEKEEFIDYLISLTPLEREKFLKSIKKTS